jgi:hypothetical protein
MTIGGSGAVAAAHPGLSDPVIDIAAGRRPGVVAPGTATRATAAGRDRSGGSRAGTAALPAADADIQRAWRAQRLGAQESVQIDDA